MTGLEHESVDPGSVAHLLRLEDSLRFLDGSTNFKGHLPNFRAAAEVIYG
jgi:hypothetical protein